MNNFASRLKFTRAAPDKSLIEKVVLDLNLERPTKYLKPNSAVYAKGYEYLTSLMTDLIKAAGDEIGIEYSRGTRACVFQGTVYIEENPVLVILNYDMKTFQATLLVESL